MTEYEDRFSCYGISITKRKCKCQAKNQCIYKGETIATNSLRFSKTHPNWANPDNIVTEYFHPECFIIKLSRASTWPAITSTNLKNVTGWDELNIKIQQKFMTFVKAYEKDDSIRWGDKKELDEVESSEEGSDEDDTKKKAGKKRKFRDLSSQKKKRLKEEKEEQKAKTEEMMATATDDTEHVYMEHAGEQKFWEVWTHGTTYMVRYGGINGSDRAWASLKPTLKDMESEEKAKKEMQKKIKEKEKKGYVRVTHLAATKPSETEGAVETG